MQKDQALGLFRDEAHLRVSQLALYYPGFFLVYLLVGRAPRHEVINGVLHRANSNVVALWGRDGMLCDLTRAALACRVGDQMVAGMCKR